MWRNDFLNHLPYRNAAQHCSQHNRLELLAWRDESGAKAAERLSQDMLATALEKAKQEMAERKKLEYMLWETSEYMLSFHYKRMPLPRLDNIIRYIQKKRDFDSEHFKVRKMLAWHNVTKYYLNPNSPKSDLKYLFLWLLHLYCTKSIF